jgi:hypothetical protein
VPGEVRRAARSGLPVGDWYTWSSDGRALRRYNLREGTGVVLRWYDDGSLEWRGALVRGVPHGTWTYWQEGSVSLIEEWGPRHPGAHPRTPWTRLGGHDPIDESGIDHGEPDHGIVGAAP